MDNNIIAYPKVVEMKPKADTRETDLLDCYRIALDYGWPAAERAFEYLATTPDDTSVPIRAIASAK